MKLRSLPLLALLLLCAFLAASWSSETLRLDVASDHDIVSAIAASLDKNFLSVNVAIDPNPPDLHSFGFSLSGLGSDDTDGGCRLVEAGTVDNLLLESRRSRTFEFDTLSKFAFLHNSPKEMGVLACSSAPRDALGCNGELSASCSSVGGNFLFNCTSRAGFITPCSPVLGPTSTPNEKILRTGTGGFANVVYSSGEPGPVIHIRVEGRIGELDFTESIRQGMATLGGKMGLGGVLFIGAMPTMYHIMPNFPNGDMTTPELLKWLTFWNETYPTNCASRVLSQPDMAKNGMATAHSHCFNDRVNFTGHYHYDFDPENAVYEAYYRQCTYITWVQQD